MAKKPNITKEYLRSMFDYDACSGKLIWKFRSGARKDWNTRYAGTVAGTDNHSNRRVIRLEGKGYYAYHLIWVYHHGFWPDGLIDHIDRDSFNDKIENLREANLIQNAGNAKLYRTNTTGMRGVCRFKKKYRAQIRKGENKVWLGDFNCPAAASFAYQIAADVHFGGFARNF